MWNAEGSGSAVTAGGTGSRDSKESDLLYPATKPTLLEGGHTESSYDKEIKEIKGVVFYKVKKKNDLELRNWSMRTTVLTEL